MWPRTRTRPVLVAILAWATCGCRSDDEPIAPHPNNCEFPNRVVDDRCIAPGVADDGCPAGTLAQGEAGCRPAGMLQEDCADGFVHVPFDEQIDGADGVAGTCEPILPDTPCTGALMAVPGDAACRPIMDCGSGTWGNIPIDGSTVFVDQSFAGTSDGSMDSPFTTIGDGLEAAPAGALVAVAAGSYVEDVVIPFQPARIWGVCPELVEVVGTGGQDATVSLLHQVASGTEIHGLTIRGPGLGILASGAQDLLLANIWLSENGGRAINIQEEPFGPTSLTVSDSLIESSGGVAAFAAGSSLRVVASELRSNRDGIMAIEAADLALTRSVLQRTIETTFLVTGSTAVVQGSVVQDSEGADGSRGLEIQRDPVSGQPATFELTGSVVQREPAIALFAVGSDVVVESSSMRATASDTSDSSAMGIAARPNPESGAPSTVTVSRSAIADNRTAGISITGAITTVDATVIANETPGAALGVFTASDGEAGTPSALTMRGSLVKSCDIGISVSTGDNLLWGTALVANGSGFDAFADADGYPANASIHGSLVERSHKGGLSSSGSTVSIDATLVRDAVPVSDGLGQGIVAIPDTATGGIGGEASIRLTRSRVEGANEAGMVIFRSAALVEQSLIANTQPGVGEGFGDGVTVLEVPDLGSVLVRDSTIRLSPRAGLSAFGAAVSLERVTIACATFDINIERDVGIDGIIEDLGGNACGCPDATDACHPVSENIEVSHAPAPVE